MKYLRVLTALVVGCSLSQGADALAKNSHVVSSGDTLWDISRSYGCEVNVIRELNKLAGAHLDVGQTLLIPGCEKERVATAPEPSPVVKHTIVAGDTLGRIALRYRSSVADIAQRNGLHDTTIMVGEELVILPGSQGEGVAPVAPVFKRGQSIGLPHRGRLKKAARLADGKGYYIRRPHRAYGASHTVGHLKSTLGELRRRFPRLHDLAIGDLSARHGGKITMHASHQNGRDVDIGFYFKKKPKGYPESFVVANRKNLHFEANWALLTKFTDLAKKPTGVDKIFMSYSSQKMFYKLARKRGVPKSKLKKMFQYPRGRSATSGIIRHEPGHDEHIHVRFKCPPKDASCH